MLWVVPETVGGISSYSKLLWPAVRAKWKELGNATSAELYVGVSINDIRRLTPDIVHIQHEFGVFGRKVPPMYSFPKWVRKLRRELPEAQIVATAHRVIGPEFRYPLKGHGWQLPLRWTANNVMMPYLRRVWNEETWGGLDGVIVHSRTQADTVKEVCERVHVIPHFVPELTGVSNDFSRLFPAVKEERPIMLLFGFISHSKGHDIAVKAIARMKREAVLVFAGTPRTKSDEAFLEHCFRLATKMDVRQRVITTGYVQDAQIASIYRNATIVIAPFRESSGSGSLAFGLASGKPVLASDISLNREIFDREPGCLALFESDNPDKHAEEASRLLDDPSTCENIVAAAKRYAESNSPSRIAERHVAFYSELV